MICDKENKLYYKEKYYNDLPSDLSPAKMKALINYGRLYPKDLVAEVLALLLNKTLLISKKNNKAILEINKEADLSLLASEQVFLLKQLLGMRVNSVLYLSLLSKPNMTILKKTAFRKKFILWNKEVNKALKEEKLFKSKKAPLSFGIGISLFYLALTLFLSLYFKRLAYLILLLLAIFTFIYALNISKRTLEGEKLYSLVMAFKRSLRDLEKTMPELSIETAEKFLPYAISLGAHQPIIDFLKNKLNSENKNNLKLFNTISIDEFEALINKILKSAELSIISTDFE